MLEDELDTFIYKELNESTADACSEIRHICMDKLGIDKIDIAILSFLSVNSDTYVPNCKQLLLYNIKDTLKDIYWKFGISVNTEKVYTYSIEQHNKIIKSLLALLEIDITIAIGLLPILESENDNKTKYFNILSAVDPDLDTELFYDCVTGVSDRSIDTLNNYINEILDNVEDGTVFPVNIALISALTTNLHSIGVVNIAPEVINLIDDDDTKEYIYTHSKTLISKYRKKISLTDTEMDTIYEAISIILIINFMLGDDPITDTAYMLKDYGEDYDIIDAVNAVNEIYSRLGIYSIISDFMDGNGYGA